MRTRRSPHIRKKGLAENIRPSAVFLLSRGWKFTSFSFRLWKQNNNCLLIQLRVSVLVLVRSRCRKNTGILHQAILTINVVYFYYLLCIGTIVSSFFFICALSERCNILFFGYLSNFCCITALLFFKNNNLLGSLGFQNRLHSLTSGWL